MLATIAVLAELMTPDQLTIFLAVITGLVVLLFVFFIGGPGKKPDWQTERTMAEYKSERRTHVAGAIAFLAIVVIVVLGLFLHH